MSEAARRLTSAADQFLTAAARLPAADVELLLPKLRLMCVALEFRLKAFISAADRGLPQSVDLGRLARLARHCGLELTAEQLAGIADLSRVHDGGLTVAGAPEGAWIEQLCERIASQTRSPDNP